MLCHSVLPRNVPRERRIRSGPDGATVLPSQAALLLVWGLRFTSVRAIWTKLAVSPWLAPFSLPPTRRCACLIPCLITSGTAGVIGPIRRCPSAVCSRPIAARAPRIRSTGWIGAAVAAGRVSSPLLRFVVPAAPPHPGQRGESSAQGPPPGAHGIPDARALLRDQGSTPADGPSQDPDAVRPEAAGGGIVQGRRGHRPGAAQRAAVAPGRAGRAAPPVPAE
jgi:hypothetical protein